MLAGIERDLDLAPMNHRRFALTTVGSESAVEPQMSLGRSLDRFY